MRVDPSTIQLVQSLVTAHRLTHGRCRPSYLSDPDIDDDAIVRIRVDAASGLVQAPEGVRLDPGSIGKGLASDLVAEQIVVAGAQGALVEIGGDLRAAGFGPHAGFWSIGVEDPFGVEDDRGRMLVRSGGVSTSGLAVRAESSGPQNVSVDPVSRRPLDVRADRAVSATVVAGTAFEAEVWSTAMLVTGSPDLSDLRQRGYVGRVVMGSGEVYATDEWSRVVSVNEVVGV